MKTIIVALSMAVALILGTGASPAVAHHDPYYGDSARAVAKHIKCKNFNRNGGGAYHKDSGVCWLKGKRVNVITFRGPSQQREWNAAARVGLPESHWWANGKGALVTAKNGNKPAAKIGAKRLPGVLRHGI